MQKANSSVGSPRFSQLERGFEKDQVDLHLVGLNATKERTTVFRAKNVPESAFEGFQFDTQTHKTSDQGKLDMMAIKAGPDSPPFALYPVMYENDVWTQLCSDNPFHTPVVSLLSFWLNTT